MSVTYRDYKDHGSSTYVDPGNTPTDPTKVNVSKLTATVIEYTATEGGITFTVALSGSIDLSQLNTPLITMADVNAAMANSSLTGIANSFVVTIGGAYAITQTFSPGLSLPVLSKFADGNSLATYTSVLSGNDVYYTSSTATPSGGAWNGVYLYGGNDTYYQNHVLMTYNDIFYGGDGVDTAVLPGKASNYKIQAGNVWDSLKKVNNNLSGFTIADNTKAANTLQVNEVERLQFSDTNLALDTQAGQNGGMAWRMYKAALNRAPDDKGLGDWISVLDKGADKISVLAAGFTGSAEFQARYGTTLSTKDFVGLLYKNVLGRSPAGTEDQDWINAINVRGASREEVLFGFSESPENIKYSLTLIGNGAKYIEHVG